MKTKLKEIILIITISFVFSCNDKAAINGYKKYIPQVFNGNELVEVPKMMTEKHKKNVIQVLKFYGVRWKVENGKLFVPENIDDEILWNYTSKANDTIWLHQHKPQ